MSEPEGEDEAAALDVYINTGHETNDEAAGQLLDRLDLDGLVTATLHMVGFHQPVGLTLMITSDEEIQQLNLQYRQQDKPTDVLSFPLADHPLIEASPELLWQTEIDQESEAQGEQPAFISPPDLATNLGDIAISWPTIQRQASVAGHSIEHELLFLLAHGVLHLLGYDDQTEAGYNEMVRIQNEVLSSLPQGRQ